MGTPQYKLTSIKNYDNVLRVTFPYVSDNTCIECHTGAKVGDVLGAVNFYIDIDSYKTMSFNYLYILIAAMVATLLGMLYAIFNIINKHIKKPLDVLVEGTRESYEKHTSLNLEHFESLELDDVAYKVNLFNQDVIQKNIELEEKNKELVALNEEIEATQTKILDKLGNIAESRSKETAYHVQRVAEYSYLFAKLYGLSEEEAQLLKKASPMHDIGKIAIPDDILKKPGKLTEEEFEIMKTHSEIGYEIFKDSKRAILHAASIIAYDHHEKWNGTGYPRGLKGEEIHIYGRITAITDVFDALASDRVYKKAWELEKIYQLLKEERGEHFDPKLVDLFFENLEQFLEIKESIDKS